MSAPRILHLPKSPSSLATIPLFVALVAGISGCGGDRAPSSSAPPAGSAKESAQVASVNRKHPVVLIQTNLGEIEIRLDGETAPGTVSNFINYVNKGFYNGTIFHFVEPGKMILGGGYSADHALKRPESDIRNEAHKGAKNVRGTIAMARSGAFIDSANSQFFINLEDAPRRDYRGDKPDEYGYCVFGQVTKGLEVADRISRAATTDLGRLGEDLRQTPQPPVVISSIEIVR
jgi:cyclophilin family peptidyl-prolyl cis-trans isomerase